MHISHHPSHERGKHGIGKGQVQAPRKGLHAQFARPVKPICPPGHIFQRREIPGVPIAFAAVGQSRAVVRVVQLFFEVADGMAAPCVNEANQRQNECESPDPSPIVPDKFNHDPTAFQFSFARQCRNFRAWGRGRCPAPIARPINPTSAATPTPTQDRRFTDVLPTGHFRGVSTR
jgi:hypothetical protein